MSVAAVTTHVLDTARGRPAAGVPVTLSRLDADGQHDHRRRRDRRRRPVR